MPPDLSRPPGYGPHPCAGDDPENKDDVLDVLLAFIDGVIGSQPVLVVGHSAGGYFAQAIAVRRPVQVLGLALLCPLLTGSHDVPEHRLVSGAGNIGPASSATTSWCRPTKCWTDMRGTSRRPLRWPTQLPSRGSASGGSGPAHCGNRSIPTAGADRDRAPGLHRGLCPSGRAVGALAARHVRRAGPGRARAPPRAARAHGRSDRRVARPGPGATFSAGSGWAETRRFVAGQSTWFDAQRCRVHVATADDDRDPLAVGGDVALRGERGVRGGRAVLGRDAEVCPQRLSGRAPISSSLTRTVVGRARRARSNPMSPNLLAPSESAAMPETGTSTGPPAASAACRVGMTTGSTATGSRLAVGRRGNTGKEPAAPDRDDDGVDRGLVLEDLQRKGAGAGRDLGLVVGVAEHRTRLGRVSDCGPRRPRRTRSRPGAPSHRTTAAGSTLTVSAFSGTKTVAGTPSVDATYALARPALPPARIRPARP